MRTTQRMAGDVCALAFALLAAAGLAAQTPHETNAPQEGIKVRGQWIIDVRNPDGTLVKRHEFENALVSNGNTSLSNYLGRAMTPGRWSILVFDGLCAQDSGASTVCILTEPGSTYGGSPYNEPNLSPNLVLTQSAAGLTLRGSFTAVTSGSARSVATGMGTCPQAIAPQNCTAFDPGESGAFSSRTLPSPIAVQAGQIVQIAVTFSFH